MATSRIILLLLALLAVRETTAVIPIECVHNATVPYARCCPENPHNGQICGGPDKGFCQRIEAPTEKIPSVFLMDDRISWPVRFFKYGCQCKGNFYGVSCNQCWFGWTGKNCDVKVMRIRKDIRSLSDKELAVYIDVVKRAQTWPSDFMVIDESDNDHTDPANNPRFERASLQYLITFMHQYGTRTTLYKNAEDCIMYGILNFNHDGCTFPTWHRYFTLLWERWLGEIAYKVHGVKDFAVPYWDWVGMKECDICNNRYIGGEGFRDDNGVRIDERHPFHNLTEFCYEPSDGILCYGCQRSGMLGKVTRTFNSYEFPDQNDIDYVMQLKHYFVPGERDSETCDSFHMALEGFCGRPGVDGTALWTHNKLHNMIDGSMCCGATATNDPLFLLHHTFVDKLYSLWYKKTQPPTEDFPQIGVRPGHCRDCFMQGFFPPVRNADMFVSHLNFGYDYDDNMVARAAQNGMPPLFY